MTGSEKTIPAHPPWTGLGVQIKRGMTADQMRKITHQDYTVSKRAIAYSSSKVDAIPIKGKFVLARDHDDRMLSIVGSVYKPVQTTKMFAFFHDFAKSAGMDIETSGAMWEGRYIWALARVKEADFGVGGKDDIKNYLLLLASFEHGKALVMQWTSVRAISWTTFTAALGWSPRTGSQKTRMRHARLFEVNKDEAQRAHAFICEHSAEFRDIADHLAKKKIADPDAYFRDVLNVGENAKRIPVAFPKFQDALDRAPGSQLRNSKGTCWGAFNAVSFVIDHMQGKSRDSALKNAWTGNQAILKRRALVLALENAK